MVISIKKYTLKRTHFDIIDKHRYANGNKNTYRHQDLWKIYKCIIQDNGGLVGDK